MLIVGLTGGIATGKSTVSNQLKETYKIDVVDADLIAKEVVLPGQAAYKQIVAKFGSEIPDLLLEDQNLNREALGKHVFGNHEHLRILNAIVHPAVKRAIFWRLFKAYLTFSRLVILDVPLLFESGLHLICGKVITVTCNKDTQLERLLSRNPTLTSEDAQKRIGSQMTNEERCYRADIVIDNNQSLKELERKIASVVKEVMPSWFFSIVDWFPPFGLLSALLTMTSRYAIDRFKVGRPKRE
ncbi:Dephospho-CoA kinase cab5 [Yamadazyma tenuis]|uniref:CoaE-domain-containing protein n=1 Tax=Candida tenuis (strain ATCC 10573 / BCRC 21748 / CBS 615 / JCM 9827 / NBRC 10315 / NRRL Y-1498 / VKM Y-70) TaxID=590646 RepID=G3B9G1_CANTC|nr:uncharacterized protein CANTEDRAFT_94753 [Yamadazyma tenuis ATCC 10573]EGV61878.1 hypothetical protein CANTEDRAFT_94753 [Yamadazyma tenuis ATCC 10573]WEJ93108.1 Dephospho-CoA kinase cab5 [Yamadazyma tenuis]